MGRWGWLRGTGQKGTRELQALSEAGNRKSQGHPERRVGLKSLLGSTQTVAVYAGGRDFGGMALTGGFCMARNRRDIRHLQWAQFGQVLGLARPHERALAFRGCKLLVVGGVAKMAVKRFDGRPVAPFVHVGDAGVCTPVGR
eukprot:1158924-Pelagomonas_calceolata.AAC.3